MENNAKSEIDGLIRDVYLGRLDGRFRDADYSKLVEYYLRKLGPNLESTLASAVSRLSKEERPVADLLIDEYDQICYRQDFWQLNGVEAVKDICGKFAEEMAAVGLDVGEENMYNVFEVITLNFALQARDKRELRDFAGIRKNWLFR